MAGTGMTSKSVGAAHGWDRNDQPVVRECRVCWVKQFYADVALLWETGCSFRALSEGTS
jgi:hypothetical protein